MRHIRNPKVILPIAVTVLILVVAILVLAPSLAKAQGLVEYGLCSTYLTDSKAPPDPATGWDVDELLAIFERDEWPQDEGAIGLCYPKFNKKEENRFDKLELCIVAYRDEDLSGGFTPYDTRQAEECFTHAFMDN